KGIEQELREQQSYTRGLIESNIDALMTTDTLGIITDVNKQMCAVTGRSREELIGTPFKDYFTEPQRAEDGIRKVLTEGRVTNYELTIRDKEGHETVVSYNATTFTGADGSLRGVFAAARDITDQKRLEGQIREQNRELIETTTFVNNILESSTEYSIIAMDLDCQILAWNEGARRNYGYDAEEMVGKQDARILHTREDIHSGRVQEMLDTVYRTGKGEAVFERVRKDDQHFTAAVAVTLRKNADGTPIGYVLISKNITEQRLLEEQLHRKNEELEEQYRRVQEANRLKSEFLANMSHELRTPLNAIIGFAELMHDGKVGPVSGEHKEYLNDILTSSHHLLQLINDVLDLAKVESGKMDFRPEPVDMPKLIGEVWDIVRALAATKRMKIDIRVDERVSGVVADPMRLKQILYNYLSNAVKFTPDSGHVHIRVLPEGGERFRLEVEDNGIGIRPEDMGRLFTEFQQLDASSAKKYPGTGLGLALTKRIVEAQGGEVRVNSTPGVGSTFYAVLPRVFKAMTEAEADRRRSAPDSGLSQATILVIEDNPQDRAWIVETLSAGGYAVVPVPTAEEALARCRDRAFDAITLDILLPDGSGWHVLRQIRAGGPNQRTPVVVLTVLSEAQRDFGFLAQDFLTKPAAAEDLLAALQRAGLQPDGSPKVLVVDGDEATLRHAADALSQAGYHPVCRRDGESALLAAADERPVAVILDLLRPGGDGFAFLERFRQSPAGRRAVVIIWTDSDLAGEDAARLLESAQAVVGKQQGGTAAVLAELRACLAGQDGDG
ncbi:MAG: PAS domain S-box protein, partial [Armatimonadetes bacterium]|nr:PAS domain S-box protein [Armatimonadota bacterium]